MPEVTQGTPPPLMLLRLSPREQSIARAEALLGFPLPRQACRWQGHEPRIARLAPGEFLLSTATMETLETALGDELHLLHEVSRGLAWFRISGPGACKLASLCSGLDLRERNLPPGSITRTRFAHVAALVQRTDHGLEIGVARSLKDYLRLWLDRALRAC